MATRKRSTTASAPPAPPSGRTVPAKTAPSAAKEAAKAGKPVPPKPSKPGKPAKPARPAKAVKAAGSDKPPKARKSDLSLVRDSFTMPRVDHDLIGALKRRALAAGKEVKKSELLRAGVHLLAAMEQPALLAALARVVPLRQGRPKKGK